MIILFPKKIFGTALCLAALWTGLMAVGVQADAREDLRTGLEGIKTSLNIPLSLEDTSIPDPQYKRWLNLMGAWFMGDQVGETPVAKGVGGSNMEIVNQLYTLLPLLKAHEEANAKVQDPAFFDANLNNQSITVENALGIYEIISKLSSSNGKISDEDKATAVEQLNKEIFNAVDGGSTVMIPVMWKGFFPGSLLMSLHKLENGFYRLRIFDTKHRFYENLFGPDPKQEYPSAISPWKELTFSDAQVRENKILIVGLLNLADNAQLIEFEKYNFKFLDTQMPVVPDNLADEFRHKRYNVGLAYFTKIYLAAFQADIRSPEPADRTWPLLRFDMGPVGNIQAYLSSVATDFKNYHAWKLGFEYGLLRQFIKRFGADSDIHFESRSLGVISEIVRRSANRLLRDAYEMARVENLMPSQIGEGKNEFKLNISDPMTPDLQKRLKLITEVMKLRDAVNVWLKEKGFDTSKLSKLNRSLGQREMSLNQRLFFSIDSIVENPADLTEYISLGRKNTDYSNCMTGINMRISSLDDYIRAFSPMVVRWKWTRFTRDVESPQCRPFFRRNIEMLLQNMILGGMDEEGMAAWTPRTQREYKRFLDVTNAVMQTIVHLPNSDRTLEDYLIIMRTQRVVWKVAQCLDAKFAMAQPARHLDLTKYSLAFPQCHKVLKSKMTFDNIFLADSGAFGNILNIRSVAELKDLCREIVDEESGGKPVLNFDKYCAFNPIIFDRFGYNRIDAGDREIYIKMSQHPSIARTVRENLNKYNYDVDSPTENGARAASLGEAGSQFIYYHFFDALKIIFLGNVAVDTPVSVNDNLKLTYLPMRVLQMPMASILMMMPMKNKIGSTLPTVNEELIKRNEKSYIKASIIETFSSHILGLDVIMNHMARGSTKFWASGSIKEEQVEPTGFQKFIETIWRIFEDIVNTIQTMLGRFRPDLKPVDYKITRRDVAGSADFYLNCSAHLLRKLDVAPGYEELVMTMLMKTLGSVDKELIQLLKDLEKQEGADGSVLKDDKKDEANDPFESAESRRARAMADEIKKNEEYLKEGKINPNEQLKSLINWAVIAIRFADRVRSLKPEWKDRYADIPKRLYSTMIKYSRAKETNNRRLSVLSKELVAHVDYFLFMNCEMHLDDAELRAEVYENLKPAGDVAFPQDSSVLPAAMVLHRMLALSIYEYDKNGPITEEFISNQYGISEVIKAIDYFAEHNESFLVLMAQYISPFLMLSPKQVLSDYTQGSNVKAGHLVYGRFAIHLIQGTFTENGIKAREPNAVLRYAHFRQFFSSGNEQVSPLLGRPTRGCESRYEIKDFLQTGSKYSICEYRDKKTVAIYRHIPKFKKPCLLLKNKRAIESLQRSFSVYSTEGVDIFQCRRGNNAHFVWIRRDALEPSYITHGRLWNAWSAFTEAKIVTEKAQDEVTKMIAAKLEFLTEFEFELKTKLEEPEPNFSERLLAPSLTFPRLEIREIDETPLFPLTAESKIMAVPEPMIRFSGGAPFGSYLLKNQLIFMFQKFRFQDRPEVALTFVEDAAGNLEMKGRDDLKVCEDQIFENNFNPALMMRKTDDPAADIRFAFVPMYNPEQKEPLTSGLHDEINLSYNVDNAALLTEESKSALVFMEAMAVEKYPVKTAGDGKKTIYGYKLKPISRLQRILLAFHNLRLRNYEESLKYLNPKTEIDHNTELKAEEKRILQWMVELKSAQEPEAVALKVMAKIHLVLDLELFPPRYEAKDAARGFERNVDTLNENIRDDAGLVRAYAGRSVTLNADGSDGSLEYFTETRSTDERAANLGIYFALLPLLPKRYHIDQVFREAMASRHVQHFLNYEYMHGVNYPITEKAFKLTLSESVSGTKCLSQGYYDYANTLGKKMLAPFTASEQGNLDKAIAKRYSLKYAAENCDLRFLLARALLHLHDQEEEIPADLQELAMIYLYLTGQQQDALDKYIYAFSHPTAIGGNGLARLRNLINVNAFKTELEPVKDEYGHLVYPPKPQLNALSLHVERVQPGRRPVTTNEGNKEKIGNTRESYEARTDMSVIMDPLLPHQNTAEKEKDDINSIKFGAEDFHYIRIQDRELYTRVLETIRDARLDKAQDEMSKLKLAQLVVKSKTQEALQQAIADYMKERKEPVDFDKLPEDPFHELKEHIAERLEVMSEESKKLERSYAKYFLQMRANKKFLAGPVLSSLRRIFNESGTPGLKDLRDCFMQMSRACLRDRLPEFSESMIVNVSDLLKRYYIQTIVFNNLSAVKRKIKEFDDLAEKAAKAQKALAEKEAESSATVDPHDLQALKNEIFDHKDTALLFVEDIYNDMEKLMLLEQRLQDPVTLNFEFMSAKFHLTNVQVQDIANLATRNWEDEFRRDVMARIETETAGGAELVTRRGERLSKVDQAINRIVKLSKRFNVDVRTFTEAERLKRQENREKGRKKDKSGQRTAEQKTADDRLRNLNRINADYIIKPQDMWAYLPRDERRMRDSERAAFEEYYNRRPMLKAIENVGKLLPYDPDSDSYFSRVIQRKMAAGKTTVLGTAATVKKADGKTLSVLVILSSLYQSSAPDMQKRTSDFFNTRGFAFAMPKPRLTVPLPGDTQHPARNFLFWTLKTLVNTINSNSYLVVTPETLQSFLNSYVEFLDAFISTPTGKTNEVLSSCLHLFATIYDIFRSRGSVILDEIDSSMRPQKELNFPTTKRENILLTGVELTADLLLHSAFDAEIIQAGLKLLANQQAALNDDQYEAVRKLWRSHVKTQLEDKTSLWSRVFFPKNQDASLFNVDRLVKFIFDPSVLDVVKPPEPQDPEYDAFTEEIEWMARVRREAEKTFHAMMVFKMQMKTWMRNCFKGAVNEHYGPAINKPDKKPIYYAIPYMAANTPADESIFADRWETVNKTFMMYLVKNLSLEDLSMMLLDLRSISQSSTQGNLDVKAEFSAACPDFELLNLRFNGQSKLIDKDGKVMQCMKARNSHSLRLIFYWVFKMVFEPEQFYAEQITSNAINLTTMFPSVQGYSGTIDNVNILPHQVMIEAEKDHRINEQANGAITMKLLQQENCVTSVQKIEDITKLDALMDAMCRDFADLSIFSAFIDVGALLKDYSNASVALALAKKFKRRTVLYYDERSNQLSFLEYDHKTGAEHRAALEGSETNYLNAATNSLVKDRFTYYDQRHITGSDILQPPTAKAFLTIGPKVLLRDILQGVMRMRQFQSGQSIHFVTSSAVEELLSKFCPTVAPENDTGAPRVTQHHLIALGALNEDEKQLAENVRLYRVKIDAELRAFVMDRLTEALAEADPYRERTNAAAGIWLHRDRLVFGKAHEDLFTATRHLFIRNVQENPVNWATINVQRKTEDAVREFYEERIQLIADRWKQGDYRQAWEKTDANLQALIQPLPESKDDPNYIDYARSVLNYLSDTLETTTVPAVFRAPVSQVVDQGSTVEMELQLELQQELQVELEQQIPDSNSENYLPEPKLEFEIESSAPGGLPGLMAAQFTCPVSNKRTETEFLERISDLYTPWRLHEVFGGSGTAFADALQKIYDADILCPGYTPKDPAVQDYCQSVDGFVGLSRGLAKVTTSDKLDFVTMTAREGTHLLFWRGRTDSSDYKYAVFLISGSEAISLHRHWNFRSSQVKEHEAFWLTDLYGFELHGSPFAVTHYSSDKFSLLEAEYEEHFADLHFRALVLNGSYNVITASRAMYWRMRAYIGDPTAIEKISKDGGDNDIDDDDSDNGSGSVHLSSADASDRIKYFMSRLTWLSKLRDEIVPSDPLLQMMLKIAAKVPVDFENADDVFDEHLNRGKTETYSDSVGVIEQDDSKTKMWKQAANINSSKRISFFTLIMIIGVLLTLAAIAYMWGRSAGIDWKEFFDAKWTMLLVLFSGNKAAASASVVSEDAIENKSEDEVALPETTTTPVAVDSE